MKVRKRTVILRVLIVELAVCILLAASLLFALPSIFYSSVREEALRKVETIGKQSVEGIYSMMMKLYQYGIYTSSNTTLRSLIINRDDALAALRLQNSFSNMFFFNNNPVISGMIILDDMSIIKSYGVTDTDIKQIDSVWFKDYKQKGYSRQFHLSSDSSGNVKTLYYATRFNYFRKNNADLLLACSFLPFEHNLDALKSGGINYALLDRDMQYIYPGRENQDWVDAAIGEMQSNPLLIKSVYENDDGFNIVFNIPISGWYLLLNMSRDTLLAPYNGTINVIIITVAAFFLIIQIVMVTYLIRVLRPLNVLAKSMDKIAQGDFSAHVRINSGDEIEILGDRFNDMTARLKENMDKLIEKEKNEQRMKYSLLISQINPHFIYNTMSSITYLAKNGRNKDVIVVNRKLIDILKDRLRVSDIEFYDTVEREMNVVDSYIVIQHYRYGDCFKLVWEIPPNMMQKLIPKSIIQPLVENALFHGLLPNKDAEGSIVGGEIRVSVSREEKHIVIEVSDNGKGLTEEEVAKLNSGEKTLKAARGEQIGLYNIRERLAYLYNNDFDVRITSMVDKGTTVVIKLGEVER